MKPCLIDLGGLDAVAKKFDGITLSITPASGLYALAKKLDGIASSIAPDGRHEELGCDEPTTHQPNDQRRRRRDIARDLESRSLGIHHEGLLIEMIGDFLLEGTSMRNSKSSTTETIYAALQALRALNRETRADIAGIENELLTGKRDADPA